MFVFIRLKSILIIFWALFLSCVLILPEIATAAVGINETVSFQGKLVNSDGTNVTNGDYNLEFKIYQGGDGIPGGGDETLKWTETRTGANKVTVTDGIFRVNLGSVAAFGTSVDWNQDTLWVSINVGGTGATPSWDGEMNPFIRLTATPYAFNAQKVNGLTVTNTTGTPFSSATTLKIGDGKTVILNNSITFSGTDGTTITFPNANDTVVVLDLAQTLTNKTIGSTGLVFSSASTDITTVSNQDLAIIPNGTGNVGIGLTNPVGKFAVSNASQTAIGKSLVIFDQYEAQDLFTASSSGITKFVLANSGNILLAAGAGIDSLTSGTIIIGGGANTTGVTIGKSGGTLTLPNFTGNNAVLFATAGTGVLSAATTSTSGLCLLSGGGAGYTPSWSTCPSGGGGGGSSNWTLDSANGVLFPINNTLDILLGGTATSSAKFGFLNINSGTPTASISASTGNNATYLTGTGTLSTTNMQGLTLGGATTGSVSLAAGSATPALFIANGGNVGIGTTAPTVRLHVVNNSTVDGSWNQGILVENTGGSSGEAAVTFKSALSSNYWFTGINGADVYDIAYGTGFFNSNVKFRINSNGQIGIGTTVPSATLDVSGSASLSGDLTFRNTNVAHDINIFDGGSLTFRTSVGGNAVTKAAMTITNSGNVGIGTTAPVGKLDIDGAAVGKALVILNETGDQAIFTASKSGTTKFLIDNNGNVGIGTTNTSNAMLSVSGTSLFQDQITVSNKGIEFTESDTNPTCASGNFNIYADLSENKLKKCQNGTVSDLDTVGGGGGSSGIVVKYKSADETVNNSATLQDDDHLFFSIGANETWTFRFVLFANSGTSPDLKAAVTAPAGASCKYAAIDAEAAVTTPVVTTCGTATAMLTGTGAYDVYEVVGTVVNGATAGTVNLQWAQNVAAASNTIVATGSYMHAFILVGSDLAELYYTNESDLVPGMVVSLDKNLSAGVLKSAKPYDTNIIGVVSTQPGLVIGEARERSMRTVPIALAGRIPVKVTNENGDIQAGDYLTSSSTPGVAMKATRSGPIIGQALEDAMMFDDHTGVVLMFVKNGFYFGSDVVLQDEKNMLGNILLQNKSNNTNSLTSDGGIYGIESLSSIITASKSDLLVNLGEDGKVTFAGSSPGAIIFDADGNAIFKGELTAAKINGIIPGLTILNDRLSNLETTVATISALVASQSAIIEQYLIGATTSASLFKEIDSLLLDKKNAFEPSVFATEGVATISGNLRVKGTGLFESVVTILDALTTRQLISTGLATFLDDVLISGDTQFRGKVTFSQDTAGIALVRKGSKEAAVIFEKPYQKPPIIHASIMTDEKMTDSQLANILNENNEFIITKVSTKGFKILLKKTAVADITFAWTAFVNAKE